MDFTYEMNAKAKGYAAVCGVDEAGRGPLAGPVYAAAVILPEGCEIEGLNDSKKISEKKRDKLFDIITSNGGDLNKTVMCHCDPFIPDYAYLDHIAKSGAYVSFDFFGLEAVLGGTLWLPTDHERIVAMRKIIEMGNVKRIVMSHDTAYKCMLRSYGGFGYSHIVEHIIPFMIAAGYENEWITQMTVENPKDIFSIG